MTKKIHHPAMPFGEELMNLAQAVQTPLRIMQKMCFLVYGIQAYQKPPGKQVCIVVLQQIYIIFVFLDGLI